MFEIIITIIALVSMSFTIVLALVLHDIKNVEYKVKDESELKKEAEEKYLSEFPDYTLFSLKSEIEKIADILIDNQPSNRYTELLREKAAKDEKVQELKNAAAQDVDIIKYYKGNLKAKVEFKDYDYNYSMILNLSTVARGRVFLNNYTVLKQKAYSYN